MSCLGLGVEIARSWGGGNCYAGTASRLDVSRNETLPPTPKSRILPLVMSFPIPIEWRFSPPNDAIRDAIFTLIGIQRTLEDVVRWGLSSSPPRLVQDVVIQDEYTHDVVLAFSDGVYLVYDAT